MKRKSAEAVPPVLFRRTMSSFENQVRKVACLWFTVLYDFMMRRKRESMDDSPRESGYGSDEEYGNLIQEESLVDRAEYRITCESVGDFKGKLKELPIDIPKDLERMMEDLQRNTKGNGQGCIEFTYFVGFSNRLWYFIGGSWQRLTVVEGLCKLLVSEWSEGKVDFKTMERMRKHSPVSEDVVFTVRIRLYVREKCIISPAVSRIESNLHFASKSTPRAVTKKSEFTVLLSKSSTESKFCFKTNSLAAENFLNLKASWVKCWEESKGVASIEKKYPYDDSSMRSLEWGILQKCNSDKLAVEDKWKEKELSKASDYPSYPPETSTCKDSRFPSPPLSPGVKAFQPFEDNPLRQILPNLPAERTVKDKASKNGLTQSHFTTEASTCVLTPPESPTREGFRSLPPNPKREEPFDVRSFKDRYYNEEPLLASSRRFSSVLKHYNRRVFLEAAAEAYPGEKLMSKENEYCPYANIFRTRNGNSTMDEELRYFANLEYGLTGRPEGKSKLFGTWAPLSQDTRTSSASVEKFQHGFYDDKNCCFKMVENLVEELLVSG